ncbi:hypothetical protein SAMN04487965_1688 [Microbulbifer donghaiensis]|uniref:Uncharacterized protein n=1 Tax=Microbulbifer donghaiensis TaxID=494016 RepID=A0A1M4ZY79_9GAMM|nr:hypothetical protein [Microbulbifer donghaiensis]SHF22978.1 hypothetical protein SAMN04487965_1688 [Microbulbifer donghaiensis]
MNLLAIYLLGLAAADSQQCINSGINIERVTYWSNINPFVNLIRISDEWRRPWDSSNREVPLHLTPDLYVKRLDDSDEPVYSIVTVRFDSHSFGEKNYTLLFDGEGDIEFKFDRPKIVSRDEHKIDVEFGPQADTVALMIDSINEKDPIRNIRLIPTSELSSPSDSVYNDQFKELVRPFSVIRFMDFLSTNDSTQSRWQDRRHPMQYGQGPIPIEDIVALANEVKAIPWLNIPHLADDNYVRRMAEYTLANLDRDLTVYVEYSNEVWNGSFDQAKWAEDQAKKAGVSPAQYYASRARHVHSIWRSVFSGDARRITRVLGTQLHNSSRTEQMLEAFENPEDLFDVLAVNYYLGNSLGSPEMAAKTLKMDNNRLFEYLDSVELPILKQNLRRQKSLADKYGMELDAYEAGQHIVGHGSSRKLGGYLPDNEELTEKLVGMNRDPRIAVLYHKMIDLWIEEGGGLINWFSLTSNYGKWGSWGIVDVDDRSDAGSPKYNAILKRTCNR